MSLESKERNNLCFPVSQPPLTRSAMAETSQPGSADGAASRVKSRPTPLPQPEAEILENHREEVVANLRTRLRAMCGHMDEEEFEAFVQRAAEHHIKSEPPNRFKDLPDLRHPDGKNDRRRR
jgi:hypothetical protein